MRRRRDVGSVQANSEAAAGAKRIQVFDKGIRQLIGENGAQHKELDLGIAMTQHLLVAADRFDLGRLRAICETRLCDTIDLESVIGTLVLADPKPCAEFEASVFAIRRFKFTRYYCDGSVQRNVDDVSALTE